MILLVWADRLLALLLSPLTLLLAVVAFTAGALAVACFS
jgi:hypothetical protein